MTKVIVLLLLCSFNTYGQAHLVDTVTTHDFDYQNVPFNTTVEDLEAKLGKPDTVLVLGRGDVKTVEDVRQISSNDFGLPPEALYRYGDTLSYRVKGARAQLATISFRNMSRYGRLNYPSFVLSKSTTLEDMKQAFPNSYASKNRGDDGGISAFKSEEEQRKYIHMQIFSEEEERTFFVSFYEGKLDQIVF